jgi:23S rRNA (cytidine1920-2'-O)/16S rRNA (cytidine1409-2'-O)-methyltransferase
MAGQVRVDGETVSKAGTRVAEHAVLEVVSDPNPFVSRGGMKLAAALDHFAIRVDGVTAIDVGASTGGFTDCLLQRGAAKIFAVDVGYGQLDWSLRQDPRVVAIERTNARRITRDLVTDECSIAVVDVSFISLAKVLPAVLTVLTSDATVVALVKPQFEAERAEVGKGGVIRDRDLRAEIIQRAIDRVLPLGLTERGRLDSPIHGPKGNIECLVWMTRKVDSSAL